VPRAAGGEGHGRHPQARRAPAAQHLQASQAPPARCPKVAPCDPALAGRGGEEWCGVPCGRRFDFGGNGESEGPFRYAGYDQEVSDLRAVIQVSARWIAQPPSRPRLMAGRGDGMQHLRGEGWAVGAILGHSKGAHCVLRYTWTFDDVPRVVNLAGRFDFANQPKSRFTDEQMAALQDQGWVWGRSRYPRPQISLPSRFIVVMTVGLRGR
jgi:hypothetical protein